MASRADTVAQIIQNDLHFNSPSTLFRQRFIAKNRARRARKPTNDVIPNPRDGDVEQADKGDDKASETN